MLASRGALAGEGSEMESINDVKDFIDVTLASIDDVEDGLPGQSECPPASGHRLYTSTEGCWGQPPLLKGRR